MSLSIIVVLISFIIEGLISNYIPMNTLLFNTLFTLISLIVIYPYFHNNDKSYLILSFITGLFYDMIYTNTFLLNAFIFVCIALIIRKINVLISNNGINVCFISLVIIIIYRIIIFSILCLVGYRNFNIKYLLYGIVSSLVLNMIYCFILYLITDHISRKKHIIKVD